MKQKKKKVSQCLWGQVSRLVLLPQDNQLYSSNKYTNYKRIFFFFSNGLQSPPHNIGFCFLLCIFGNGR